MKVKLKKQLQAIANISQDRVYFDVPDELADEMFDLYDPSDLYSYLTQKERNQAYKDMRGIGANSRQVQMEWKKKALWRIAKAKAWDDLYELDENILRDSIMRTATRKILNGVSVREALNITIKDPETGKFIDVEADPWKNAKKENKLDKAVIKHIIDKVVTNNRKYLDSYGCYLDDIIENKNGKFIVFKFLTADDDGFYTNKISDKFGKLLDDLQEALEKEYENAQVTLASFRFGMDKTVNSPSVHVTYEIGGPGKFI